MIHFILNDKEIATELPPGTLLLDYIRYHKNLMGTKIGCREGDCGACTVLVGEWVNNELRYRSATSCLMAIGNARNKHVVTIEGINVVGLNPIQEAFSVEGASQCGFCTPGFMVSLAGFSLSNKDLNYKNAIASIDGNICRCTGYKSIERAVSRVVEILNQNKGLDALQFAVENNFIPAYFLEVKNKLQKINPPKKPEKEFGTKRKLGGGTDLYVQQPEAMIHSDINFLFDEDSLHGIWKEGDKCFMGASTTVTDILESPLFKTHFGNLEKFIKLVSSTPIRNMATVAGNFVNASPIGDLTVFLLSLNAHLILSDGISTREIPLRDFYQGYKKLNKKESEFIQKIWFYLPEEDSKINFEKVSKRTHLDIATVNSAAHILVRNGVIEIADISAGGVGPIPLYLANTSSFLKGKHLTEEIILEAIEIGKNEISPISDVRGSETYKRLLFSQFIKAHFLTMYPELNTEQILTIH